MRLVPSPPRSGYTTLCANVIFPLHEILKRHDSTSRRRALEQSQWWGRERLERHQLERLREFLSSVRATVPYYQALFRSSGLEPEHLRDLGELGQLPFLTKALVRANTDALKARGATGLARYNTGGSTGEPLIFYIGKDRVSHDVAAKWRATRWWGVDIGDPEIVVWGSPIELGAQDWVRSVRDRFLRTTLLPAFQMSAAQLDRFVRAIQRKQPRMVFGYPSALAHIAQHVQLTGSRVDHVGIQVAFVTGERLYPEQRELIERVFGCRVANGYGGRDAGFLAHECAAGGMHITAEDIIVEIVGADGKQVARGTSGEIVVTHMATGSFPFIRYRTGDIGTIDERMCICGRGLPLLKALQGRTTDFVIAQDGTVMHGLSVVYLVRDVPGIARFKIVQESIDHTRVLLVTDDTFDRAQMGVITAGMRQRLGQSVRIDIDLVRDIPAEASGKYRYVVSNVAAANQHDWEHP